MPTPCNILLQAVFYTRADLRSKLIKAKDREKEHINSTYNASHNIIPQNQLSNRQDLLVPRRYRMLNKSTLLMQLSKAIPSLPAISWPAPTSQQCPLHSWWLHSLTATWLSSFPLSSLPSQRLWSCVQPWAGAAVPRGQHHGLEMCFQLSGKGSQQCPGLPMRPDHLWHSRKCPSSTKYCGNLRLLPCWS